MILAIYGTGGSGKELDERTLDVVEYQKRWKEIVFIDDTKDAGLFCEKKMYSFVEFSSLYSQDIVEIAILR